MLAVSACGTGAEPAGLLTSVTASTSSGSSTTMRTARSAVRAHRHALVLVITSDFGRNWTLGGRTLVCTPTRRTSRMEERQAA